MSRIEINEFYLEIEWVRLSEIAKDIKNMLELQAKMKGLALIITLDP